MAFNGLYDFDVIPYAGDLTKYGQGPGHQWFDFYGDQNEETEPEEETEEETEAPVDPGTYQQQQGGPDGGRGQNSHPTDLRSFDSIADYFNDPDVQKNGRALMDMIAGASPTLSGFNMATGGYNGAGPQIPAFGMNDAVADEIAQAAAGGGYSGGYSGGASSPAESYSGGDWSGPAADPNAGDGEQGGLGGNRDGGWRDGGRINTSALPPPRFIRGPGDGRSDSVPAFANGGMKGRVRVSDGEFVWPADTVSAMGNGSSEAGARRLGQMAQQLRQQHMARMSALPPPR